jgi:hypothetical protein
MYWVSWSPRRTIRFLKKYIVVSFPVKMKFISMIQFGVIFYPLQQKTGNLSRPFLLLYIKILMKEATQRIGLSFSQKDISNEKNLSSSQKIPFRFCQV